ncbi:MAG: UDP-N-acetylmuramoyl-tripeptide--D-alanyl-D-alanine ligase [Bacteroidales bacterium]|nr:UDP-N-acetylmuramoyl-tripeptide--D-alanyl-D-alanine ligase [Bacteroidales bacterium]
MLSSVVDRLYEQYRQSRCVTTDTRQVRPGCIFFAFKGASFDGNALALDALEKGAALCVVSNPTYATDDRCILVDDVLKTLQALALRHRQELSIPVVGITGTNGKTTTKELVRQVLSMRYRVHATPANHNNHLGLPLTILSTPTDAEILVVEMGANHPGEIADLCAIALPTCGLITNVGIAHIEGFGSFEGVVHTKTELYRHLAYVGGTIFVNADNERLMREADRVCTMPEVASPVPGYLPSYPIADFSNAGTSVGLYTYGRSEQADVKGSLMESDPYMRFYIENDDTVYTIRTHLLGDYNYDNAMAAAAVGRFFNVDPFDIKQALEDYQPSNNRSQVKQTARNTLFLDCYNANPSSMAVAIENFQHVHADHKAVILGQMGELGAVSHAEHQRIVQKLAESHLDDVILVGDEFRFVLSSPEYSGMRWFESSEALIDHLALSPIEGKTILVKGSNTNHLWQLEQYL